MRSYFAHYVSAVLVVLAFSSATLGGTEPAGVRARLDSIGRRLLATECFEDSCRYQVFLPTLEAPVEYGVALRAASAPTDSLAPCSYIIRWKLDTPSGPTGGFSAYFGGNHFRFANKRLQEYHAAADGASFAPGGKAENGVQRRAQFADLLPQFIGEHFVAMASDTTYSVRISSLTVGGRQAIRVDGIRRLAGCDAQEFEYILDAESLAPISVELENNPGQLGEQTVNVQYLRPASKPGCAVDMQTLVSLEPEAFEKYRTDTYSLEQLVGEPLPLVAVPATDGTRYIHHRGEPMAAPTVLVFCNTETVTTPALISAVRSAMEAVPGNAELVWMFADRRAEDVAAVLGETSPGETAAFNSGSAIRDLGVGSLLPVIVFVDRAGRVADFVRGYNNDLESVVIQKASLTALGR